MCPFLPLQNLLQIPTYYLSISHREAALPLRLLPVELSSGLAKRQFSRFPRPFQREHATEVNSPGMW